MSNEPSDAGKGSDLLGSIIGVAKSAIQGAAEGVKSASVDTSQIQEHMEVVGSDGQHVGFVDHVEGAQIKLARQDPAAGGQHHYIPVAQVERVVVRLSQPAEEARRQWGAEQGPSSSGMR